MKGRRYFMHAECIWKSHYQSSLVNFEHYLFLLKVLNPKFINPPNPKHTKSTQIKSPICPVISPPFLVILYSQWLRLNNDSNLTWGLLKGVRGRVWVHDGKRLQPKVTSCRFNFGNQPLRKIFVKKIRVRLPTMISPKPCKNGSFVHWVQHFWCPHQAHLHQHYKNDHDNYDFIHHLD